MDQSHPPQPWIGVSTDGSKMLRPKKCAESLGVSVSTFYEMVKRQELPAPRRIAPRATGIPSSWIDAVIAFHCGVGPSMAGSPR